VSVRIEDFLAGAKEFDSVSETPDLDMQTLLCKVLGQSTAYLYTHNDTELTNDQLALLNELITRRKHGEPIAYLTGYKGFWTINLQVNSNVLIPRPETELLVEMALEIERDKVTSAVDLGTGSGAIAIALAKERPEWQILATDISASALSLASENALMNNTDIKFLQGSWCNAIAAEQVDLIISNPPYIDAADAHLQALSIGFEPRNALVADDHGLSALREIIRVSAQYLVSGGQIILEHGYNQSSEVCDILTSNGYQNIQTRQDISGHDRAIRACKP
jgi:release factor glutamine methyltransferase